MGVFLLFIDGIGLGPGDPAVNPFAALPLPALRGLLGGRPLVAESFPVTGPPAWAVAVDAGLDVAGLPQSATGQTTILTGVNAARAIGRHLNAYPTPTLRTLLERHSLFRQVRARGYSATLLNAYRPEFFRWLELTGGDPKGADPDAVERIFAPPAGGDGTALPPPGWSRRAARRYRPSASTVANLAADLPFRTLADVAAGKAVYHDLTHWTLAALGHGIAPVSPEAAGRRAAAVAARHDFTFYEHFMTDFAGHRRDWGLAERVLDILDRFLGALLAGLDPDRHLLLIISDHGNLEDLSVRTHTRHPVPAIARGRGAAACAARLRSLTDVAPAVLAALDPSEIRG